MTAGAVVVEPACSESPVEHPTARATTRTASAKLGMTWLVRVTASVYFGFVRRKEEGPAAAGPSSSFSACSARLPDGRHPHRLDVLADLELGHANRTVRANRPHDRLHDLARPHHQDDADLEGLGRALGTEDQVPLALDDHELRRSEPCRCLRL